MAIDNRLSEFLTFMARDIAVSGAVPQKAELEDIFNEVINELDDHDNGAIDLRSSWPCRPGR